MIAEALEERLADRLDAMCMELAELHSLVQLGTPHERMLNRRQLAEALSVSVRSVDALARDGAPLIRIGGPGGAPRFLMSEVTAWLRKRSNGDASKAECSARSGLGRITQLAREQLEQRQLRRAVTVVPGLGEGTVMTTTTSTT